MQHRCIGGGRICNPVIFPLNGSGPVCIITRAEQQERDNESKYTTLHFFRKKGFYGRKVKDTIFRRKNRFFYLFLLIFAEIFNIMKKTTFILLLCATVTTTAFGQKGDYDGTKKNVIKANILSPIVKSGSFFFERKINDKSSAQLGIGFTGYKSGETKFSGIAITPEYRFYVSQSNPAISGFYIGPFVKYANYKLTDDTDKATLSTFGGGLTIGRQWIFSNVISLDIFAGPSYSTGDVKVTSGSDVFDVPGTISGFGLRAGVTIGVAF